MRPHFLLALAITATAFAAEDYPLGPDSKPQAGVPQGEVKKFTHETSKIFPGTKHEWSLYLPKQYDAVLAGYRTTPSRVRSLIRDGWLPDTANASYPNARAA